VNLLNSVPLTPGGVGLVEGGMTASLHAAGLDVGTAAAVALSYRLVSYWLPLALTIPVTVQELATVTRRAAGCGVRRADGPLGLETSGSGSGQG
jgi:hypothetical protein